MKIVLITLVTALAVAATIRWSLGLSLFPGGGTVTDPHGVTAQGTSAAPAAGYTFVLFFISAAAFAGAARLRMRLMH